jgi:putative Mg2+ transporter-C (MgtC) family protein
MTERDMCLRLVLAVVLGAIIGAEREISMKPAGLRTNILICLGAAIFTMVSILIGTDKGADPTRIASQVATGMGFIGAGAIMRGDGAIHGLTTAATLWLVAAIGMCCGAGLYSLGTVATGLAFFVLLGLSPLDRYLTSLRKNDREDTNSQ